MEIEQAKALRHELAERDEPMPRRQVITSGYHGDPWLLRGIPVVGAAGAGGASPGTRPGANLK